MQNEPSTDLIRVIALVSVVMLVLAVFEMPYGFYTLLRLVVTAAAAIIAWRALSNQVRPLWAAMMGLIALLFNPFIPVYLTREVWFFIDILVAVVFIAYVIFGMKHAVSGDNSRWPPNDNTGS